MLLQAVESGRRVQIVRFPDFYGISTDSLEQGPCAGSDRRSWLASSSIFLTARVRPGS